ncbi:restriction endonuclease subunit S [Nitrosomonas sp.]|uniref:restriction endonuclease subunit S n=1 Tax=Nitrosomonas sp. TaxID=42353 RepID=UPI0026334B04|nr:restriction endonuclease subunit S [Nitrosomonas sp.]
MNSWCATKLKNVCDLVTVGFVGSMAHEYCETGIPFLRSQNITPFSLNLKGLKYIDEKFHAQIRKSALQLGDVAVVRTGYPGTACVIPRKLGIANCSDLVIIRPGKQLNPHFLCSIFNSTFGRDLVDGNLVGAAQQHFNITVAKELKLLLPPRAVQDKIAAILTAHNELIENNQRRIALLEKMAEEIYREWFVRLRFPGHENVKNVKGIPEGWEIDRVDSIGKIVTGKTPSTDNPRYFGGPYFFIKTPDMHGNIFILETEERLSQNGLDSQPSQTISRGSICVSCIGTGGIVSITTSECQTNQQINSVVVRNLSDLEWAFFTLRNLREAIQMFGATGATMTNLSKGKFSSLKILRPNKSIVLKYHALVNPIFVQIQSILQQTMILRSTRDLLLPRLISGKLSVEHLDIRFPPGMEESACD